MLKNARALVVTGLLALFMVTIGTLAGAKEYADIDASGVKEMMASDDVLVIFPLSPIEFDNLQIKGSINIPMDDLESRLPKDKSQKLIFYCLGVKCVASWRAAEEAVALGYENVYAFRDGLPGWTAAGYPTVTINKLPDIDVKKISTSELAYKLANQPVVLIDLNLTADAHKFYIDDVKRLHIPLDELHLQVSKLDPSQQIILMCLKGKRAPTAARYLAGKGYTNVVVVEGGLQQWVLEGRPVKQGS
jgi:rhodanese-related sulfurtransferase